MSFLHNLSRSLPALLALMVLTGCPTKRFNTEGSTAEIRVEIRGAPDKTLRDAEEAVVRLFQRYGFEESTDPPDARSSSDWRRFARPGDAYAQYTLYHSLGFMGIILRDEQRNYDRSEELREEIQDLIATLEGHFPDRPVDFQHWLHFGRR